MKWMCTKSAWFQLTEFIDHKDPVDTLLSGAGREALAVIWCSGGTAI